MKNNTVTDIFVLSLAAFLVVIFTSTVILLLFHAVPQGNKDMVNIFLGTEGAAMTGVFGYYFGSSKGSSDKNAVIAQSNPPTVPQVEAPKEAQK